MSTPDFNLLITLDALLSEGSVARAARRLRLSPSAMSRALARLRETTGDPLLVRAGRGLVPTPRALALREQVKQLVLDTQSVLRPADQLDLPRLARTFVLRASDGFVENFGAPLLERLRTEAPKLRLRFLPKLDKDSELLRNGTVDLEAGVVGTSASPELRTRALFEDRFIGVVRAGHPLSEGEITPERFAAGTHILVSRRTQEYGPVQDALAELGLKQDFATIVTGFGTAVALARSSDLIATVPERYTATMRDKMFSFPLPIEKPPFTVSMLWHPRMDGDAAHRWLRACVLEVCGAA
jgi:DNA-binding transcriptional LysR family regulator